MQYIRTVCATLKWIYTNFLSHSICFSSTFLIYKCDCKLLKHKEFDHYSHKCMPFKDWTQYCSLARLSGLLYSFLYLLFSHFIFTILLNFFSFLILSNPSPENILGNHLISLLQILLKYICFYDQRAMPVNPVSFGLLWPSKSFNAFS